MLGQGRRKIELSPLYEPFRWLRNRLRTLPRAAGVTTSRSRRVEHDFALPNNLRELRLPRVQARIQLCAAMSLPKSCPSPGRRGPVVLALASEGMSCPSRQWHRAGYRWSPVRTLLVAPLWCDMGLWSRTVVVIKLRRTSVLKLERRRAAGSIGFVSGHNNNNLL